MHVKEAVTVKIKAGDNSQYIDNAVVIDNFDWICSLKLRHGRVSIQPSDYQRIRKIID